MKPASCGLCGALFQTLSEQRLHVKSDWHGYNLKQRMRNHPAIQEAEFERLIGDLAESISGSESSESENDKQENAKDSMLTSLLKKQAELGEPELDTDLRSRKQIGGAGSPPLLWFSSPLVAQNIAFGIYRALFTDSDQQSGDLVEVLRKKQLKPVQNQKTQNGTNGFPLSPSMTSPTIFLCMIGGGHFAAMVVSLCPRIGKKASGVEERQAIVVAHKTFHRYTTRRKQGGSQSTNDSAKGAAHSAGAGIRRYNEAALEAEVRALLNEWKDMINTCKLRFIRATGTANRKVLYGPYDGQVLRPYDSRNRTFPFSTRRATQAELMRAFIELTRLKVSQVDEATLAAGAADGVTSMKPGDRHAEVPSKPLTSKPSKEEEVALLHTSQLQALIRRSKAPAVLSYLTNASISPNFVFCPPSTQANRHASTPLHLAASINSPTVVLALMIKGGADPTVLNGEGKPPFDIAGDRATRDAFRVARSEIGEDRWNWEGAHCPSSLSKSEADERDESTRREAHNIEVRRREVETERLRAEELMNQGESKAKQTTGKTLGAVEKTGSEKREQEARGLTPELRAKLERERRARAAEERMRRLTGGASSTSVGR